MMKLFEGVLRADEYRRIRGVASLEQDFSASLLEVERRLGSERDRLGVVGRLLSLARRSDYTLAEKWRHHWRMRRRSRVLAMLGAGDDPCIMPWFTLTVRADGSVPVCCVLQDAEGDLFGDRGLEEIWNGERMSRLRREMQRVIADGPGWRFDVTRDREVRPMCSCTHPRTGRCHIRSFYYCWDLPFFSSLRETASSLRPA